ncbi:MAG: hypothetical protein RR735_10005, partial [Bacteroidales bacterium]
SKRKVLKQKNITCYNYYTSRQRLQLEGKLQESSLTGSFIPVVFDSDNSKAEKKRKSRTRRETELAKGNVLTIEMRTSTGTELRIQGQMNISMLREILYSSSGGDKNV